MTRCEYFCFWMINFYEFTESIIKMSKVERKHFIRQTFSQWIMRF